MSKAEHSRPTPLRTCVGCRRRATADELVRCALTADGRVVVSRTAPGRGAWLCGEDCLAAAVRQRRFGRAWRRPVGDDIGERVRQALVEARGGIGNGTGAVGAGR